MFAAWDRGMVGDIAGILVDEAACCMSCCWLELVWGYSWFWIARLEVGMVARMLGSGLEVERGGRARGKERGGCDFGCGREER